jgi:hypothetical protein
MFHVEHHLLAMISPLKLLWHRFAGSAGSLSVGQTIGLVNWQTEISVPRGTFCSKTCGGYVATVPERIHRREDPGILMGSSQVHPPIRLTS